LDQPLYSPPYRGLRWLSRVPGADAPMRRVFIAQIVLIGAVAGAFLLREPQSGLAALYGGSIALGNAALLAMRVARQSRARDDNARADVVGLYLGALQRFVFTLLAMALGMGLLRLDPVAILLAFAVAQLGLVFGARGSGGYA
jgi:ATP synthase protein I